MPAARSRKKSSSKKMSKSAPKMAKKNTHPLMESYYHDHQEEFHKAHPNSKLLLTIFIVCVIAFFVMVYLKKELYMPGLMY